MKKVMILVVLVALGAATTSCQDEAYNDVEETILDSESTSVTIDDADDEESTPGES